MTRLSYRHFVHGLMPATALSLALLPAGAMSAYAGSISVTGGNGQPPGGAAPPAAADEGNLIPNSDALNTAAAKGGNGGAGGSGVTIVRCTFGCYYPPPPAGVTGGAGGAATATATTSISSATQATATASSVGGAGGAGGLNKVERYFFSQLRQTYYSGGVGGVGGTGSSSATALNTTGSASSTATATGGTGGVGGGYPGGPGGAGGGASASSKATGGSAGPVLSQATAYGGAGGRNTYANPVDSLAYGGPAQANATSVALKGNALANASAYGGWSLIPGTAASAQSDAKNSKGEVLTTASAPADAGGISPSAVTSAGVGPVSIIPITINSSQVVSDAILTPIGGTNRQTIGEGAMSAAFSGGLLTQTYAATAVFDFTTSASEALDLTMLSDEAVGFGFNSLQLQVINLVGSTPKTLLSETFSSFTAAETFFKEGNSIPLGAISAGSQSITIDFSLSYWNSPGIVPMYPNFGFSYALMDPQAPGAIPETSTWVMMLLGFVGLGLASWRRGRGPDSKSARVAGSGAALAQSSQ